MLAEILYFLRKVSNMSSAAPVRKIHFGSTQERRFVPFSYPPNRLGNEYARHTAPNVGPGSYENHQYGSIVYDLEKTPMSQKGYGLSARTAKRFPTVSKSVSPSPQQYQPNQALSRIIPPGNAPFNSTAQRFKMGPGSAEQNPGPGTYSVHGTEAHRRVRWPMCFGSPDWNRLPQLDKTSLRVKMPTEKEFLKQRGRLAYLSLYY
ncbi:hypothetical protein NL108_011366 [Boleophthalmus pectinirostris]|uniref:protein pitchfork n=1 Tax=Boleophthalmus pectinirostris TaxID=150288 RepID=UPI000A1C7258|nr:protein pitchfork [Boleophthalmus pectinirostris]KAJ0064628.1 hypothetical protein NL108_011366 [Boleophthalmus pectinirostris]